MNFLKDLAVTLIGFGFVVMGGFILLKDQTGEDTLLAGAVILFFGAVGLVGLIGLLPASLPKAQPDGRFIVNTSRLRAGVFAFGGLAFLVAGIVMPLHMMSTGGVSAKALIGALGVPFGLAVLVFAGRQMFTAGPLYILDADGIESCAGLRWRLAWRDISDIGLGSVGANRWLMFETFPHVPDPPGKVSALNRRFNMPPYALTTGLSGVNFNALAGLAGDLWEAHRGAASTP
ncbi:MAG: hypothetical protein IPK75_15875 [Acidobacteria bacterium]|jgi:hypothetical protein|nr:hypothetical protein [Acidobacteriota bacterium]